MLLGPLLRIKKQAIFGKYNIYIYLLVENKEVFLKFIIYRWETLLVLREKIAADELLDQAEEAFQNIDIAEAIRFSKEAHVKYKKYTLSPGVAHQCQLILSVAAAPMEWTHDEYANLATLDKIQYEACSHARTSLTKRAQQEAEDCLQAARIALKQGNVKAATQQVERSEAYFTYLGNTIPNAIAILYEKLYFQTIHAHVVLLKNPETVEYSWLTAAYALCDALVSDKDHEALTAWCDMGVFTLLLDGIGSNAKSAVFGKVLVHFMDSLVTFEKKTGGDPLLRVTSCVKTLLSTVKDVLDHSKSTTLVTALIVHVMTFANTKQRVHVVLKADFLPILVMKRSEFATEKQLVFRIVQAVNHFLVNKVAMELIYAQGGVTMMLSILRRAPKREDLVLITLQFFTRLVHILTQSAGVAFSYIEVLLNNGLLPAFKVAVESHKDNVELLVLGVEFVDTITFIETARLRLLKQKVVAWLKNVFVVLKPLEHEAAEKVAALILGVKHERKTNAQLISEAKALQEDHAILIKAEVGRVMDYLVEKIEKIEERYVRRANYAAAQLEEKTLKPLIGRLEEEREDVVAIGEKKNELEKREMEVVIDVQAMEEVERNTVQVASELEAASEIEAASATKDSVGMQLEKESVDPKIVESMERIMDQIVSEFELAKSIVEESSDICPIETSSDEIMNDETTIRDCIDAMIQEIVILSSDIEKGSTSPTANVTTSIVPMNTLTTFPTENLKEDLDIIQTLLDEMCFQIIK